LDQVEFIAVGPDSTYGITLYETNQIAKEFITKNPRNTKANAVDFRSVKLNINAINPYNNKEIPVFIANYVLGDYGTGVVMAVPSVCKNDHDFAMENNIPVIHPVKINENYVKQDEINDQLQAFTRDLIQDNIVYKKTVYKLKDWCISRQRYWGCPIPIIYCKNCGTLENKDLPVHLAQTMVYGHNTEIICWKCGANGTKEKDTMDTFVDSSWYTYRYPSATNTEKIFDDHTLKDFPQVHIYVGGPEHAVLHLLFARFFGKMLKDMKYIEQDEPFASLFTQGMICMQTYKTKDSGMFVNPDSTFEENNKLMYKHPGGNVEEVLVGSFEKMSKSKKNTIDPEKMLNTYGVDALRLSVVSDTPADKDLQWNTDNLNGCWAFINRIWFLSHKINENINTNGTLDQFFQEYSWNMFYKIINNLEQFSFNVAIANIRILVNYIEDNFNNISGDLLKKQWIDLLSLLWTICPVVTSEALEMFNVSVDHILLPFARSKNDSDVYELVLQVNGKKYATIEAMSSDNETSILEKMRQQKIPIKQHKKIIFIKNKVMNFVC
jgi:leucyl-tRNA synthetase